MFCALQAYQQDSLGGKICDLLSGPSFDFVSKIRFFFILNFLHSMKNKENINKTIEKVFPSYGSCLHVHKISCSSANYKLVILVREIKVKMNFTTSRSAYFANNNIQKYIRCILTKGYNDT